MPFLDSLDIANRALQHCGASQIASPTEDSKNNTEVSFAYDKARRAELRRNAWRFAIKKVVLRVVDTTTLLIDPPLHSLTTTYLFGAIVKDTNNIFWVSIIPDNINNVPGGNNEAWDAYFGPLTASLWASTNAYYTGELVFMVGAYPGSTQVFMSLVNSNIAVPNVADAWVVTTAYLADQEVSYGGFQWRSLLPYNVGTTPAVGPLAFDPTATYSAAQTVTASDNFIYSSVVGGNIGHDPTTDIGVHWTNTGVATAWAKTPTLTVSSGSWLPVSTTLKKLNFLYPIGAGPSTDVTTKNVFRLPAGFLRKAAQDPKAGSTSYLGAPSGRAYEDWNFEGDFLISSDIQPIILRFIADVTIVARMDDMFCEGLACRIATMVCDTLTQSQSQLQTIASAYKLFMGEARTVNAIEIGSEELPEDDFITCRQ